MEEDNDEIKWGYILIGTFTRSILHSNNYIPSSHKSNLAPNLLVKVLAQDTTFPLASHQEKGINLGKNDQKRI